MRSVSPTSALSYLHPGCLATTEEARSQCPGWDGDSLKVEKGAGCSDTHAKVGGGGSPPCLSSETWAPAMVNPLSPHPFLFLWTHGSQPDLTWSSLSNPKHPGKLGNVQRHFWLSQLGWCSWDQGHCSTTDNHPPRDVTNTRTKKLCSRSLLGWEGFFFPFLLHCRTEM